MQKSLMSLTAEIVEIERTLLENNGNLTPEIEARLDLSGDDLRDKIDAYKNVLEALEWRAAYFKSIKDQAAAAQKTLDSLHDRLKNNLKFTAKRLGTTDLNGNDWRFKISDLKPKIVHDGGEMDAAFLKEKIELVPDREAIEKALLLGFEVAGFRFEEVQSLRTFANNAPKQVKGK